MNEQLGSERFDAAVIGLGAAGCWAAKVLCERGMRVLGIDAGRLLTEADLPRELAPAPLWRRVLSPRHWIQSRSISFHPRLAHLYVDDHRNPYATHGGEPFLWIRGRQVGGRMHTWARMALRLAAADFTRARADGHGIVWPIDGTALAPHYATVERFLDLKGERDGLPQLPDGELVTTSPLAAPARLFRDRVLSRYPQRPVIAPRVLTGRIAPMPAPLDAALATGRLTIASESPVARLTLDDRAERATGVELVDARDGARTPVRADRVFLCASAIESVRILLNSSCPRRPRGLGNAHDLLGRYVLDHNLVVASGPTPAEYRALMPEGPRASTPLDLGADIDFYLPDFTPTLGPRDYVRGFGVQGRIHPTQWGMGVFGEMLPDAENRVTLTDRRDAFGIRTANIRMRRGENDLRMIAAQKAELRALAAAAGLPIKLPIPGIVRPLVWKAVGPEVGVMHLGVAIHETGGARMGDDPRVSVVDPQNRLWEAPNVYVTDGACFPNTGSQNPTLTIMALTVRAATLAD